MDGRNFLKIFFKKSIDKLKNLCYTKGVPRGAERKKQSMWCYKIRYYSHDENIWLNAEGLVAGLDMVDAIKRLKEYYGEDAIEDIRMTATESGDGVLDFAEFPDVRYATFFPEEN